MASISPSPSPSPPAAAVAAMQAAPMAGAADDTAPSSPTAAERASPVEPQLPSMSSLSASQPRLAYVTLVTSDSFVVGAQVLAYSLRRVGASYPLFVLCTPNLSSASVRGLAHAGWTVLRVQPLSHGRPAGSAHVAAWDEVGYTKLRVWQLTQFARVLYIDADCLVQRNVDHLLRDVPSVVAFAASPDVFPPDKLNAGVMLLRPDRRVFDAMLQRMSHTRSYDGGDTGFLNAFFAGWFQATSSITDASRIHVDPILIAQQQGNTDYPCVGPSSATVVATYRSSVARLGFGYNALRVMQWFTKKAPGYWEQGVKPGLHIVHYCSSPKPWEDLVERRGGFLEQEYFETYDAAMAELKERDVPHGKCDVALTFELGSEDGVLHLSDEVRSHADQLTHFQALQAYLALHLDKTPFGEFTLEDSTQPQAAQQQPKQPEAASTSTTAASPSAEATSPQPTASTGSVRPIKRGVWMSEVHEDRFLAQSRAMLRSCLLAGASSLPNTSVSPAISPATSPASSPTVATAGRSAAVAAARGIPRLIHQIWLGGPVPEEYDVWRASWTAHHPETEGWTYRLWGDAEFARSFPLCGALPDASSAFLAAHLQSLLARCGSVAQRSDLFRLDILWTHGGLYVDTDFECLASLAPLHTGGSWAHYAHMDAYAGFSNSGAVELNNGLMATTPQHPLIGKLIQSIELPPLPPSQYAALPGRSATANKEAGTGTAGTVSHAVEPTAMEVITLTGPGHFTRITARFMDDMTQRIALQQRQPEGVPHHSAHVSHVCLLPAQVFFPLPNSMRHLSRAEDKRAFVTPMSFAMHHWSCSWQKKLTKTAQSQETETKTQEQSSQAAASSPEAPSDTASVLALVQRLHAMKRNAL